MSVPIKRNDTAPLEAILKDRNGPVDLSPQFVTSIDFAMRQRNGSKLVTGSPDPDADQEANRGLCALDWADDDTDTAGVYDAEWQINFADGTVKTFPNEGYEEIIVGADIAA